MSDEYYMPKLRRDTGPEPEGKPYTFNRCLVEGQGNLMNLIFLVDGRSLNVPVTRGTARELMDKLLTILEGTGENG